MLSWSFWANYRSPWQFFTSQAKLAYLMKLPDRYLSLWRSFSSLPRSACGGPTAQPVTWFLSENESTWPGEQVAGGRSSFIVSLKAEVDYLFEIFGVEFRDRNISKECNHGYTFLERSWGSKIPGSELRRDVEMYKVHKASSLRPKYRFSRCRVFPHRVPEIGRKEFRPWSVQNHCWWAF